MTNIVLRSVPKGNDFFHSYFIDDCYTVAMPMPHPCLCVCLCIFGKGFGEERNVRNIV